MCGAVKIAVLTEERTAIFTAPLAVILMVVEQLVVGQASLLYNLVVGEVDFSEAVVDFHVEDVEEGVKYALSCGATLSEIQFDERWRVLIDPAGHPFCILPPIMPWM